MSAERTAEEWGRLAVSLPGWRWMPGMLQRRRTGPCMGSRRSVDSDYFHSGHEARVMAGDTWPDPDDPATEGCLARLLGPRVLIRVMPGEARRVIEIVIPSGMTANGRPTVVRDEMLGRACIAAAEALGQWPGGGQ